MCVQRSVSTRGAELFGVKTSVVVVVVVVPDKKGFIIKQLLLWFWSERPARGREIRSHGTEKNAADAWAVLRPRH